jgi:hypothetical protein
MSKAMEAILARRFSPFDFSSILGFPNVVPTMHEWGDYLLRFRGYDHDHPAQHLIYFHQYMDQLDIHHEDVYVVLGRRGKTMVSISSCFQYFIIK